jgi:hypothetical protein
MPTFKVKYQAGSYFGTIAVNANCGDEAIAKVRTQIRREMSLPMYSDNYKIVGVSVDSCDDDEN